MIFTQAIERNAQVNGKRTATIFGDRRRTWSDVAERIARLANALQQKGINPGDRVAILALNSDRYLEYYYAVVWAGAVMVPLNVRWSIKENQYALEDSGAVALFVDDTFLEMGVELTALSNKISYSIYMGEQQTPEGMLSYEALVNEYHAIEPYLRSDDEMIGIFYTGGTTGFPKGVMLSGNNVWSSAMGVMADFGIYSRQSPNVLVAAPMFHGAAGALCWSSVIGSVTLDIVPAFDVKKVIETIEKDKVTDTLLVPTMISMLMTDPAFDTSKLSSLKQIIYGASPMPEGTLLEAMEKMPNVEFMQAYGQTELSPVCSILSPKHHVLEGENAGKIRSAGRANFTVTVAIKDANGKTLAANEIGEICAKGPNVMMGYWNNPEQTASAIKDGWLYTGDAGYIDEDGFIFLVDRVKDMIISGGENIFSAEVESAVSLHPAVQEVAVVGIPSAEWGESVHAIIRLKEGQSCDDSKVIEFCREHIAGYKLPRSIEFREQPFPMTGANKIQKNALREPYWENADRKIN
ncbi:acyl-CoA synthetase [Thalassotalea atypica]|uniref:acyl-CoA synthetase n=1 Tax=Thalassotalea atypica TaxID=2054316 RepID=UPI0025728956|nr:long-chain fatty acid--CoA ligase [Thalassotalea atypica]